MWLIYYYDDISADLPQIFIVLPIVQNNYSVIGFKCFNYWI